MKAHIGVGVGSACVHTVVATASKAHDITEVAKPIRSDDDEVVYGGSDYIGWASHPNQRGRAETLDTGM